MPRSTSPENDNTPRFGTVTSNNRKRKSTSALELGPRKRPSAADPLVHYGRHFGRTVFAFANVHALILQGLSMEEDVCPETQQERREHRVYRKLLKLVPNLEERLVSKEEDEDVVLQIAGLLQKGASCARADDTRSLKGSIVDMIRTSPSEPIAIDHWGKAERGFNHERTGQLLCPAGMDWSNPEVRMQLKNREITIPGSHWPVFIYKNEIYDPEEPWRGLFRSELLVMAFKHIFTSPSSNDSRATPARSGNARIHGMTSVTPASIAYVATQVRFALSSASIFSRTDKETDSETFYTSILELFEDPEEQEEVKALMAWWNRRVFPAFSNQQRPIPVNSPYSKVKAKRKVAQVNSVGHVQE